MLTIQLLGGFNLTRNGEPIVGLTKPRGKALLAYLLLHHETPQERAHLAYTFWPETSDRQARTNLRRELHQLRQTDPLFQALIESDGQSVQWQMPADATLDVTEFTRLLDAAATATETTAQITHYQAAIELYHGDLLPGLYDEWLLAKREELNQTFLQALETVTTLLVDERDYATAITLTQRLLHHDPLYEASYAQLMELYAHQNDRARALHTYHTCVTVLERELGVPPSDEIETLYQRLHQAEDGHTPRAAATTTSTRLVGRKTEWQTLLQSWRRAGKGHAQMLLIEGEAGIGKTRLGEELLEWVHRQGIMTARTRSYAAEGALAYAPVIEWLRSPTLQPAIVKLDTPWRTELARLLPELLTEFSDLPHPEPLTERWQRQRLFEALARAITVDNQPKLLLIDDLQWCDQETLEWLRFLLRFAPAAPLLVLGTVRTEEVEDDHPLHALTRELQSNAQLTTIELAPLSANETTELAAQVTAETVDEENADRLFTASEGNPLFVVEMARAGFWEENPADEPSLIANPHFPGANQLPPKVYAVIQHRLAQLSPVARPLADLAAVMGRGFTYAELVAASNGDEEMIVNGLDELWQRKVIREQGANAYDFSHDRIRETAYAALSPLRRKLFHQRIVQMLKIVYHTTTDTVSGELAFHCEQAGLIEDAVTWYQRAGHQSSGIQAFHDAVGYQRSAIALCVELSASDAYLSKELRLQIDFSESLAAATGFTGLERQNALLRARELALELNDLQALAQIIMALANLYLALGDASQIYFYAKEANILAGQVDDVVQKAHLYAAESRILLHSGDFARAEELLRNEIQIFRQKYEETQTPWMQVQSAMPSQVYAFVQWIRGYPDQAANFSQKYRILSDQVLTPYLRGNVAFIPHSAP